MTSSMVCEVCTCVGMFVGDDGRYYCGSCGSQSVYTDDTYRQIDDAGAISAGASIYHLSFKRSQAHLPNMDSQTQLESESQMQALAHLVQANQTQGHFDAENDYVGRPCVEVDGPRDFLTPRPRPQNEPLDPFLLRSVYVEGLQKIIQMQCRSLVSVFNVNKLVCGIAGSIWLRMLALSRVLRADWPEEAFLAYEHVSGGAFQAKDHDRDRLGRRSEVKKKIENQNQEKRVGLDGKRASEVLIGSLKDRLPVSISLAIAFLSCHIAREPVLPIDIIKWALEGKLPYLAAFVEVEKSSIRLSYPATISYLFRPDRVIEAYELEIMSGRLARRIGLKLPPVNYIQISCRFLKELGLPVKKLFSKVTHMYDLIKHPGLWISDKQTKHSTRDHVMAILIVLLRIVYNIHGQGYWESSIITSTKSQEDGDASENDTAEAQVNDIEKEASSLLHNLLSLCQNNNDELEFVKDLSSYLKYCRNVIFVGRKMTYDEEKMVSHFWKLYNTSESEMHNQTNIKDGDTANIQDQRSPLSDNRNENPTIKSIISEMYKNGFYYLPPWSRELCNSYHFYKSALINGVQVIPIHADYYILLRACAKVIKKNIQGLHACVVDVERMLRWVEHRINDINKKDNENDGSV